MSTPTFPAAKKGDRISHDPKESSRSTDILVAALLGQSLSQAGTGGALSAQAGAGASCKGASPATLSVTQLLPRSTTGTIEVASPTVFLAPGQGAAMAEAEPVDCRNHSDKPIEPASNTVLVQGVALARTGGQTGCGAILCDGSPTVLAGGPASTGKGTGTQGGTPVSDAIAAAESFAGGISSALAAVTRGAALLETTVTGTLDKAQGAVSGALSALTGAFTGLTKGGPLGALTGSALAGSDSHS